MRIPIVSRWLLLGGLLLSLAGAAEPPQDIITVDPDIPADALLADTEFTGLFPFLESRIRQQTTLRPGGPFRIADVQAQITRLHEYYQRNGYFNSWFAARARWDVSSEGAVVRIRAHRGVSLRWGRLLVTGADIIPRGRIRTAFPDLATFTPQRLREGVRELRHWLRTHDYIRGRVTVAEQYSDFDTKRLHLTLNVEPGPLVTVRFEGNHVISDGRLRRALTFVDEGRVDHFEIEASLGKLQTAYLERGYPAATIQVDRDQSDPTHTIITFHIEEGTRQTIWDVDLVGNRALSDSELASSVLTRPIELGSRGVLNPKILIEDERALREAYRSKGFLDAVVGPTEVTQYPRPGFFTVKIPITEGARAIVRRVMLRGNQAVSDATLQGRLVLLPGVVLQPSLLPIDRDALELYYMDHGYPYAIITQSYAPVPDTNTYVIAYDIDEGPQVNIGRIAIQGDFLTSQRAMRKAFNLEEGTVYSDARIRDGVARLRRLGAFRTVTVEQPDLAARKDRVDLTIRVEEERPFQVDFDLGYSTRDQLTSTVRFTNINTFGWAKRTQLLITGGLKRTRGELAWIDPWFLGTDLLHSVTAWVDRAQQPAFDLIQSGAGTSLIRQYHRTGYLVRYQMTQNRFLNGDSVRLADDGYRDTVMSQLTAGVTFDTRDNFANPRYGSYLSGQMDLFNELRGQRADYIKFTGGATRYLSVWKGLILSGHARAGGIVKLHDATIPITDRFFLGGEDTVRGFSEDAIGPVSVSDTPQGGLVRWIGNVELTAPITKSVRAALFYDIGGLANSFNAMTEDTIRHSAGIGVRYLTPIGPIRFDYGYKLDRRPGENPDRFHFTFGHVF